MVRTSFYSKYYFSVDQEADEAKVKTLDQKSVRSLRARLNGLEAAKGLIRMRGFISYSPVEGPEGQSQFPERLWSACKLKLTCEGWICQCSQVKICKGSRTLRKFLLAVAKGTTRKSIFKKLVPGGR